MEDEALFARVWSKDEYHHVRTMVRAHALLLDEAIPHYGVKNPGPTPRRLLFLQLADSAVSSAALLGEDYQAADTDDYQYYEWQHAEAIWGTDSLPYLQALVHNRAEDPLQYKFTTLASLEETLATFRKHPGTFQGAKLLRF